MNPVNNLDKLFSPKSIAIVGASETPGKIGAIPVSLLIKQGYTGQIYPVNPNASTIQGLPCYPSLDAIPHNIDLVIISVPAKHAYAALAKARPDQVASAVIFSSGFAEIDAAGKQEQSRLLDLAQARNMRLLGPNCLGFMNPRAQVYATFSPAAQQAQLKTGNIGIVTQSGAFGAYAYSMMSERQMGLSYWITTGNETELDVADCITFLAADPDTDVIMAYMEGCKDGDKLKRAFQAAHIAGKRIVITKIGRTEAGAQAAASHTAAMAGNDAVYEALFHQYGVLRAHTIEEFFNLGHALSIWKNTASSQGLGILSLSGGVGALMADEAVDMGLPLPELSLEAKNKLLARVPFAGTQNPVDITGQAVAQPEILIETATNMLDSGQFGGLVVFLAAAGGSATFWPYIEQFAQHLHEKYPNTLLAISALLPAERRLALESVGCLSFADPSMAIRTMGAIIKRRSALPASLEMPELPEPPVALQQHSVLNEAESLAVLKSAGIPALDFTIVDCAEQAYTLHQNRQGASAMKILSRDILHKSDIGGIKLNVASAEQARSAYDEIWRNASTRAPKARLEGVLVSPMLNAGTECIAGVHTDPVFGPVVMFGLGGIFVEYLQDISFRLAPFDEAEALEMIHETKASQILQGARGKATGDIQALAKALSQLSILAHTYQDRISSIDINPLVVLEEGHGVCALDALVLSTATP